MAAVNGWLNLDKPTGITSARAVSRVKALLKCDKIGHGGTLDPLASGVLPLALGEATKLFDYVASERKTYRFTVTWGQERDTGDAEGATTAVTEYLPMHEDIVRMLPEFIGDIWQTPPAYSAIKIDGKRAYDRARAGEEVKMEPRRVHVYALKLLSHDSKQPETVNEEPALREGRLYNFCGVKARPVRETISTSLEMECGKGTYVRSVAQDLGRKLGSLGYVTMLRRAQVGKFHESAAISLENLESLGHTPALTEWVKPVESMLDDILAIEVDSRQTQMIRNGQKLLISNPLAVPGKAGEKAALMSAGKLIALAELDGLMAKPIRVFNH